MEEQKQEKSTNWCEEITTQVEKELEQIVNEKVSTNNVDYLYRLVDIHKDLANETYWKEKIKMYGNRYTRDFSGYGESSYGRRGVKGTGRYSRYRGGRGSGRYRGEEAIDDMYMNYSEYNEANQSYNEGNYGAEGGMKESAEGIMENIFEIVEELKDTGSPEVMQVIKKYSKKISEM